MVAFADLLGRVAKAAKAEGIRDVLWHWDISDYSESAPNATVWWTVQCGKYVGAANDGRGALESLCKAMGLPIT